MSSKWLKPVLLSWNRRVYSESMVVARIEKEIENMVKTSNLWGVVVEVHPNVARSGQRMGRKILRF